MILIPVNAMTRYMIAELNGGVIPDLDRDTYFVWSASEPAEIVSGNRVRAIKDHTIEISVLFAKSL